MLKKLACAQLRLGMFVQDFVGPWMDHPFWRAKFLIGTDAQLNKILACGVDEVWTDPSKGLDVETDMPQAEVRAIVEQELESLATMPVRSCMRSQTRTTHRTRRHG